MKRLFLIGLLPFVMFGEDLNADSLDFNDEITCMALNIYHEARSEQTAGMRAVADVVINRVKSSQFPNTVCDVVKQGPVRESWKTAPFPDIPDEERIYYPKRGQCQFSWYCDGRPDEPTEPDSWIRSLEIAKGILNYDIGIGLTDGSDHYHTHQVNPAWNEAMMFVITIGNHKFYKYY